LRPIVRHSGHGQEQATPGPDETSGFHRSAPWTENREPAASRNLHHSPRPEGPCQFGPPIIHKTRLRGGDEVRVSRANGWPLRTRHATKT
jgi:hypothetical protein